MNCSQNGDTVLHYCVHRWSQTRPGVDGKATDKRRAEIVATLVSAGAHVDERNEVTMNQNVLTLSGSFTNRKLY